MQGIAMPDLVRLLARVGARRMGDPALPVKLAEASAATRGTTRQGALRGEADAALVAALHVFNASGDRDDGGVLGVRRRAAGPREADDFRPLLLKVPGRAWLRIALEAEADASARARRGQASGRARAVRERRLLCYRQHAPDTAVASAIATDLARFASVHAVDDACALGVGDACALEADGTLSGALSVAWDRLLAAALPGLDDGSGRDAGVFVVEVDAEASASLALSIEDGCSVAIARLPGEGDRAFRVAVRRLAQDERSVEASLGIAAGFADPAAVARVLAGSLANWLDLPAEALEAIRSATSLDALPDRYRPVAAALADRFGLGDVAPLAELRERLEDLDGRLAGRVEALARTRAAVQVEAEFHRRAGDALLLEAELSETALRRLHPALVALDIASVLADRGPGVAARSLLHDRTIERLHGWTIGASLGRWFELSSRQQREDRWLERRRVDTDGDRTRHAYLGATRYTARANGWSTAYGATFEAVDEGTGAGVGCALEAWWQEGHLRADADGLARIVDDAVLWGVIEDAAAPTLHARLAAALDGVGRCRPRFERVLEADAVWSGLRHVAGAKRGEWARHAARALPRNARVPTRADCASRVAVYGTVLAALARSDAAVSPRHIGAMLRDIDPRLAARERKGNTPWTTWRVLRRAGLVPHGPSGAWRGLGEAAAALVMALDNGSLGGPAGTASPDGADVGDAFARLRPAFEQPFLLRTVASLLSSAPGVGAARLRLSFQRDGQARSLLVGA
ncbi:MAG TPA: hypothetical protein VFM73_05980 [Xanthomonadaceae bacterium]|nr:hypothetical protein [Xanthomonadaceae bacterium]